MKYVVLHGKWQFADTPKEAHAQYGIGGVVYEVTEVKEPDTTKLLAWVEREQEYRRVSSTLHSPPCNARFPINGDCTCGLTNALKEAGLA